MIIGARAVTKKMAFKCPPETLLRPLIHRQNAASSTGTTPAISPYCTASGTYKAALITELGKPLQVKDVPRRNLKKGEVRVNVKKCGIQFADLLMAKGEYQEKFNLPFTAGSEASGVVLEVGEGVDNVSVGDNVMGMMAGSFAQETVVNSQMIMSMPDEMTFETGASLLTAYGTAQMALTRRANIKEGDVVLVTAAAGAVGLAAVDLAANVHGATVIAACGGPEKCELVKKYGAKYAIDYKTESIRDRVMEITKKKGANIIYEVVGGDVFKECLRSIAFEGRLIVIGFASGTIPQIPANILLVKSCSAVGIYWGSYSARYPPAFFQSIMDVMQYSTMNKVKPYVCKTFPLQQINEAFQFIQSRKSTGKVIVDMEN